MVESDDKKMIRVVIADGGLVAAESVSGFTPEEPEEEEDGYDSDIDGDLFLYQMAKALEGVTKEELPKINFRRKHPQLGKKLANVEQRLRRIENTIASFKQLLAPYLIKGLKDMALKQIDEDAECLIDLL